METTWINTYDSNGRLTKSVHQGQSTEEYTYDDSGRLISITEETIVEGGDVYKKFISRKYDKEGRIAEEVDSSSATNRGSTYRYVYEGGL